MHHCVIGNLSSWETKLFPKTLRYKLWELYLWGPLSQLFEMKMTFLAFTREFTHSQHIISVLSRSVGEIRGMTDMILEILYKCGARRRTSPGELLKWSLGWVGTLYTEGIGVPFRHLEVPKEEDETQRSGTWRPMREIKIFLNCGINHHFRDDSLKYAASLGPLWDY